MNRCGHFRAGTALHRHVADFNQSGAVRARVALRVVRHIERSRAGETNILRNVANGDAADSRLAVGRIHAIVDCNLSDRTSLERWGSGVDADIAKGHVSDRTVAMGNGRVVFDIDLVNDAGDGGT